MSGLSGLPGVHAMFLSEIFRSTARQFCSHVISYACERLREGIGMDTNNVEDKSSKLILYKSKYVKI